jgi:dCMP deaminase
MNEKTYFQICNTVASNSKCLSRQIGAIIVRDKEIISTGYNGPPRGMPHCEDRAIAHRSENYAYCNALRKADKSMFLGGILRQCPREVLGYGSGEGLEWCPAGHAERNAIINAGRNGISVIGCKIYMNCSIPCPPCLVEIINSGIEEIICTEIDYYGRDLQKYIIETSGIKIRTYYLSKDVLEEARNARPRGKK